MDFVKAHSLSGKISYNKQGVLNGEYIEYFSNGNKRTHFYYKNGRETGEQKKYYENGNLALQYSLDGNYSFFNKYLALKITRDTLYYTDLGKEGTGYLKRYDICGTHLALEIEGKYKEGQYQDTVRQYFYDCWQNKYIYMDICDYRRDSTMMIKLIKRVYYKVI